MLFLFMPCWGELGSRVLPTAKEAGKCSPALPDCNAITVERADLGEQLEALCHAVKTMPAKALRCVHTGLFEKQEVGGDWHTPAEIRT